MQTVLHANPDNPDNPVNPNNPDNPGSQLQFIYLFIFYKRIMPDRPPCKRLAHPKVSDKLPKQTFALD